MRVLRIGILAALAGAGAWAQATAQIHGVVQDMSGAAIPGAMVTATQTDTGISRTVTSEADGGYVIPNLPLGPYQVEVNKAGFATVVQMGIVLQVNSDPAIPVALKVGAVSERVSVEANATQVETTSVGVGSVVENQRILDLPLNGRHPQDLVALSGAAVQIGVSGRMNTGYLISVAGGTGYGVEYNLDGAQYINFFDGTSLILPFPDALQEFKISTSTQDPSNGSHSGATVDGVMKSGTNSFHGDVFEFMRNSDLNGRDFFATGPDGLKRNQFGGTFGGAIKKDKLFFFLGYQGTFVRQTPIASLTFVPTPQMLQGDFTAFASAACQGTAKVLKAPFVNNMINPAMLSPAAVKIAARLPSATSACGNVEYATPLSEDDHEGDFRVDYQVSDKQSLFIRNVLVKQLDATPYTLNPTNVLSATGIGANDQFDGFTLGDTYLLSATKVNAVRLYLNRISAIDPAINMFGPSSVGISQYTYTPNYLTIPVTGAFSLGGGNYNQDSFAYTTAFGANDTFSWVHGSHQFSFGGFFTRSIEWSVAQAFSGGYNLITGATTGTGLSDFLLGDVSLFKQANPNPLNLSQNFVGLHAGDAWKITPRLTVTYGVNWDPFFGQSFQQGDLYNFSLANYYAGVTSKVVSGAPPGFTFPGDPGFPGKSGINSQFDHFDPRLGLAWDPFGDGKTAIRMGAGIAHDFIMQDLQYNTSSSLPFRLAVQNSGVKLDNPFPQGDPFPYTYNPKNPVWPTAATVPCLLTSCPPTFLPIPPNLKTHEQYSWNLGVQRQITQSLFLAATYLGTHIIHLWDAVELNPAVYIAGNCNVGQYGLTAAGPCTSSSNVTQRRVLNMANPNLAPLGSLTQYDDGGTQSYNGLLLSTNYRLRNGVSLNANYTWSHCIGIAPTTLSQELPTGSNYVSQGYGQNVYPQNRNLSVGDCVQDRRQIANITIVYETPQFSNRATRIVASGWMLGSTIQARTGAPLPIVTNVNPDPANGFGSVSAGTQRPEQVLTNVYSPTQGASCGTAGTFCEQWLNPAAFALPALGTPGNMGTYTVFGPSFWQWDVALSRAFRVVESQRIELRAEAFNVTNSLRLGNPGIIVGSASTFGLITTDATPPAGVTGGSSTNAPARVMQFALKYVF
jgi:hypothetical protein